MDRPPARLFCALSQNKEYNIVLRRGPSRQVAVFGWNRNNDTFQLGQWLKGKVYDHRLDISPDGKHFIYLALGRGGNTWTAVSRTPYFKAVDFYPWSGTWGGGGIFHNSRSYALNGSCQIEEARRESGLSLIDVEKSQGVGRVHHASLYSQRLLRDGWSWMSSSVQTGDRTTRFDKQYSKNWILRKCIKEGTRPNRSIEFEYHELVRVGDGLTKEMPDWEWAEVDGNMLVWAEHGCLYRAQLDRQGMLVRQKLIHDFNDYIFEERVAPY